MPEIRKAEAGDVEPLVEVLARAFADDPMVSWTIRPDARRAEALRAFFRLTLVGLTLPHGEVYTETERRGAALWTPPGAWSAHWTAQLRHALAWGRIIGWGRLASVLGGTAELSEAHPQAPHAYLMFLGVDPERQGQGLGRALLQPMLARCDAEGLPAYLEASRPTLVPYYRSLGFAVQRELQLGPSGPPVACMWREPARRAGG